MSQFVCRPTDQVIARDRKFWRLTRANKEAAQRNSLRPWTRYGPTYEWRVVLVDRRWQLVAFQNLLKPAGRDWVSNDEDRVA